MRPAWVTAALNPRTAPTCTDRGRLFGGGKGKGVQKGCLGNAALPVLKCFHSLLFAGELLSQPRPEGLTEIICPKNGSERVNVALVYPPTPTVISPCSK